MDSDVDSESEWNEAEVERVEICSACGVSMLPSEMPGEPSACENPECEAADQ